MKKNIRNAEEYADIILNDERENIVSEKPTVYTDDKIERVYEFGDGAVVKYEWQSEPAASSVEKYNHRFTLLDPPTANDNNLEKGTIKVIDY
jgi:phage baseplate assembly protein gpV